LRPAPPDIEKLLRTRGLRSTTQRRVVLEFLWRHRIHATADEIFAAVNRAVPRASRATIYNNIRDLVEAGLVREVTADGRAARYDACVERHHHFICDRCGALEDLEWFDLSSSVGRPKALAGHVVRDFELLVRGACRKCSRLNS
jgi:Fur family peroxide stress response transcriptional regulator